LRSDKAYWGEVTVEIRVGRYLKIVQRSVYCAGGKYESRRSIAETEGEAKRNDGGTPFSGKNEICRREERDAPVL